MGAFKHNFPPCVIAFLKMLSWFRKINVSSPKHTTMGKTHAGIVFDNSTSTDFITIILNSTSIL